MGVNYSPGASGLISGIRFVERDTPNYTDWCYPNSGITVHHAASTSSSGCNAFEDRSRNASAHYYVCDDQIQWWVSEKDGAWHGGASFPNTCTIGIETKNSSGSPDWLVAEKTFDNLARLMADIAIRHEWGKLVVGKNVWGHRDFSSTACPGPYLYPRLDSLVRRANEFIDSKGDWFAMATYEDLKKAVIAGGVGYKNSKVHGNKDVYQLFTDMLDNQAQILENQAQMSKRLDAIEQKTR